MLVAAEQNLSLPEAAESLKVEALNRLRGQRHDITTNKGVVKFLNECINAFILDKDGEIIGRNELNTLGYVCGQQLKAIQAVQEEEAPPEDRKAVLNVNITMSREERKAFLTAGTESAMLQTLEQAKRTNEIDAIDLNQQSDGSFAVKPLERPPATDAPMPLKELGAALPAIPKVELRAAFGPSLGTRVSEEAARETIETFGFDDIYDASPKTEPLLAHEWTTTSYPHPALDGVVVRVSKCTRCGLTTKNTRNHESELCGSI